MKTARNLAILPSPARYKADNAADIMALYAAESFSGDAEWLKILRETAADHVAEAGLPTPRLERWKYTNILPHVKGITAIGRETNMVVSPEGKSEGKSVGKSVSKPVDKHGDNIVRDLEALLQDAPSWLAGILAEKPQPTFRYADMMLWNLNNMFLRDGVVIDVPAGTQMDQPVEIRFGGTDNTLHNPRSIIRVGDGAVATVIEYHEGDAYFWNNAVTQIKLGKGAVLRHYRIQDIGSKAVYTQNTHVEHDGDSHYEAFSLTRGGALSRNQVHAALYDENINCDLYGINLLENGQVADSTFEVEHQAKNCISNQFVRNVIRDHARGIFQGKVYVHEGADGTDGYQLSNALLLSEGAEMDTKPELEIYADEVKCSHGATTGQLDEEPLFYLRSRGLSEEQARALMIEAFVNEIVEKLADETVKQATLQRVKAWLG